MSARSSNRYLRTDNVRIAVLDLETAVSYLKRTETEDVYWRWALASSHSATQGFMVAALQWSDGLATFRDSDAQEWMKAYREGTPRPRCRLDTFLKLYKKIRNPSYMQEVRGGKAWMPGGTHGRSMRLLNSIRNEFTHYLPKTWFIELAELPDVVGDALEIVEFLIKDSHTIAWGKNRPLRTAALEYLDDGRGILQKLRLEYRQE